MYQLNKSGFSLLEIMIAMGLIGFASIGALRIADSVQKTSKTSEVLLEINSVLNTINQTLVNSNSCTNTFKDLGPIESNLSLNEIRNHSDAVVFETTKEYGQNKLKISEISLSEVDISPPEPGHSKKFGNLNLNIKFEKLGKNFFGQKYLTKSIPINAEFDLTNNLTKCHNSTEDTISTAEKESCQIFEGIWDGAAETCTFSSTVGPTIIASTENLDNKLKDLKDNFLPQNYVQKIGDTMTGTLTISVADLNARFVNATDSLKAANSVCVGTRCQDFSQKQCNKNSLMVGVSPDGTPICKALQCPTGFYLEKLDFTSGNVICKVLPKKICPLNQYVSRVLPDGSVTCSPLPAIADQSCPSGQFVWKIAPNGIISCANPNLNWNCPARQYVGSFDANGKAICRSVPTLQLAINCDSWWSDTGYRSGHDDRHHQAWCNGNNQFLHALDIWANKYLDGLEDFKCCSANFYWTTGGLVTPTFYKTGHQGINPGYRHFSDGQWHLATCPGGQLMYGIRIYATEYLDELEDIYCASPAISTVYSWLRGNFSINQWAQGLGWTSDSRDNAWHTAQCSNGLMFSRTTLWANKYLDNWGTSYCGSLQWNNL